MKLLKPTSPIVIAILLILAGVVACSGEETETVTTTTTEVKTETVTTTSSSSKVPQLISPLPGTVMDNTGPEWGLHDHVWEFDWSDVPGATRYHIYISNLNLDSWWEFPSSMVVHHFEF